MSPNRFASLPKVSSSAGFGLVCLVASACSDGGESAPVRGISTSPARGFCERDADCDDGLACNGLEVCEAGRCALGPAPRCDDGDACTLDGCTEPRGCVHIQRSDLACTAKLDSGVIGPDSIDASMSDPPDLLDPARPPVIACKTSVPVLDASTQQKLELYRGIQCVEGKVILGPNVTDLSPLAELRSVGALQVSLSSDKVLALVSLEQVEGDLNVEPEYGDQTTSTSGAKFDIPTLKWIGGSLRVHRGIGLDAFASLRFVGGDVALQMEADAPRPEGSFRALTTVLGDLALAQFGAGALSHLEVVGGNLLLDRVEQEQVDALPMLRQVGGALTLVGTAVERGVFPSLERVSGTLRVEANAKLRELSLPMLTRVGELVIRLNPALSRCQADALQARLTGASDVESHICCNLGCDVCGELGCERLGAVTSGQSTAAKGEVVVGAGFDPEVLRSVERAEILRIEDLHVEHATVSLPLRHAEALIIKNTKLPDLSLFSSLDSLGELQVLGNTELRSLSGLERLERIGGLLRVASNAKLEDVSSLDPGRSGSLREVKGETRIVSNPRLSQCEASALVTSIQAISDANVTTGRNMACAGTCDGPRCLPAR